MKIVRAGLKWRTIMVLAPLALLVVIALMTSGLIPASSAQYNGRTETHFAPLAQYGVSNQMLYVANGRASNVKVIDVGTMSIVDTIPVPNEATPAFYHELNTGFMNWEVHGVVPSQDRTHVYAVGALSGGSYNRNPNGSIDTSSTAGDPLAHTPGFRLADYRMYDINTATKATERSIPMQGGTAGQPVNPAGYCGLEYNLNDESSNEIIGTSMNASNANLLAVLGVDLGVVAGRTGDVLQDGGWAFENITTGANTGFMSTDANSNNESSTCGVSWNAAGTRGFAAQMFEPLVTKVNWSTRTADGTIAAATSAGTSYHQSASDKAAGKLYVASSSGSVDMFDMNTNTLIGAINIRALTGTNGNDIHGVELAPGNSNIMYVTSRSTPDDDNTELVVDISNPSAPVLKGSVSGLAQSVCGVYAIANKATYYGTEPSLSLSMTSIYWASYADYTAHKLSVNYSVSNTGSTDATNVTIVSSSSSAGVTIATALPASVGSIAGGGSASVTLQYNVPGGTATFGTTTGATAQNGAAVFTYPS